MNEYCIAMNEMSLFAFYRGFQHFVLYIFYHQTFVVNSVYLDENLKFPYPSVNCVKSLMQPVLFSDGFSARINNDFKILILDVQILGTLSFIHKNRKLVFFFSFAFLKARLVQTEQDRVVCLRSRRRRHLASSCFWHFAWRGKNFPDVIKYQNKFLA